jgi:hypothetical protein
VSRVPPASHASWRRRNRHTHEIGGVFVPRWPRRTAAFRFVFVDRVRFSLDVVSCVVDGTVEHRASIQRVARGRARGAAVSLSTRKTSSRSLIAASRGF